MAAISETMPENRDGIRVDQGNFARELKDVPLLARKALGYALNIRKGRLSVTLPDRRTLHFEGREAGPRASIVIHDYAFARRLASGGDIGFAEAYLRREWDTPDLTRFLELFCVNHSAVATLLGANPLARLWQIFRHAMNRNSKRGSRRNIHAHYDLGNRFYSTWLDRTMTYSSAVFAEGDNDLASAQDRKYRVLAEATGIGPNDHVLEIGCGWGGFAEYAAREIGCRVTGLTISREQFEFASQRIAKAGLSNRVTLKLQDYRDESATYDRIVSIEMFEAVGEAFWPVYFRQLRDRLRPGGSAGLQIITIDERLFPQYRRELDFIRRYIFPGGMLPTRTILNELAGQSSLTLASDTGYGLDYARTLSLWRERFRAAWPGLPALGFDDRFRRMWDYYLSYCEAGFLSGNIDVRQVVFGKPA
jgi:cyclopropane-fatty-acyl-phospholipid synthase